MKRLLVFILAFSLNAAASAASLYPIQLLDTTGSTAGQTILSTGASSAPSWGSVPATALTGVTPVANGGTNCATSGGLCLDNITGFSGTGFLTRTGTGAYAFQSATNGIALGNLVQASANTLLGNGTGSTANLAALSVPSCGTTNSALQWVSGTGFSCASAVALTSSSLAQFATTTSAQLAGVLSDETGTGSAVFNGSPTITTPNTVGVANASNAAAGSVGETNTVSASGVALTSGNTASIASQLLTAGDWDVSATVGITGAGGATLVNGVGGISTTAATVGALGSYWQLSSALSVNGTAIFATPIVRISTSTSTTVYCVALGGFSSGTASAQCVMRWRRAR